MAVGGNSWQESLPAIRKKGFLSQVDWKVQGAQPKDGQAPVGGFVFQPKTEGANADSQRAGSQNSYQASCCRPAPPPEVSGHLEVSEVWLICFRPPKGAKAGQAAAEVGSMSRCYRQRI